MARLDKMDLELLDVMMASGDDLTGIKLNEEGKMAMMRKEHMRQKLNIKSPDRWDTYCFTMLVDYVPAN
ncbi:hypothetical protein ACSLOG_27840, partial [Escherichia coli]